MRYGSLCSGIEAASVAFHPLGWEAAWYSEIEPFPCAVLDHHYPNVPNHGDMTTIADRILGGEVEAPDMICGGTPCQAFSVAGLRQSLADDRGNLTLQFIKICDATDTIRRAAGKEPCWILYENVPGLLSTGDNAFGAFLGGLCGRDAAIPEPSDGWTGAGVVDGPTRVAAWRILNAEHFGLAQRRQRVFVLALGGAGRWAAADALLPIIESGCWHPAPRRGKGEGLAAATAPSLTASGRGVARPGESRGQDPVIACEVARTLTAGSARNWNGNGDLESSLIAHTLRGEGFDASEDGTGRGVPLVPQFLHVNKGRPYGRKSAHEAMVTAKDHVPTLTTDGHQNSAIIAPMVMANGQANAEVVSDGSPSLTCNHEAPILVAEAFHENQRGEVSTNDTAGALGVGGGKPGQGYPAVCVRMREGKDGGGKGPLVSEDQSLTLATANDQVLAIRNSGRDSDTRDGRTGTTTQADKMFSLQAQQQHSVLNGMQVRRLTPRECERLQGFPDDYLTSVTWRGKCPPADGVMYKALGNSWAVPCARYIGERIMQVINTRTP